MLLENRKSIEATKPVALMLGALMVLSVFSVLFVTPPMMITPNDSDNIWSLPPEWSPIFEDAQEMAEIIETAKTTPPSYKVGNSLKDYYENGVINSKTVMKGADLSIIAMVVPGISLGPFANHMKISSSVELGLFQLVFGYISSQSDLRNLVTVPGMLMVEADSKADHQREAMAADSGISRGSDQAFTREFYGIDTITAYDGTGATVAVIDTGTDFGQANIADAIALDTSGYPSSFSPGADNLAITPFTIDTSLGDDFWLNGTSINMYVDEAIGTALPHGWANYPYEYLNFTGIQSINTASGKLKFGILYEDLPTDSGIGSRTSHILPRYQSFFCILADETTPGVYDHLYISWDYSAVLNWFRGVMIAAYYNAFAHHYAAYDQDFMQTKTWALAPEVNTSNLVNFNETAAYEYQLFNMMGEDVEPYNTTTLDDVIQFNRNGTFELAARWDVPSVKDNFIMAKDFDGDNHNDISAGSLANTLDLYNVFDPNYITLVSGIVPDGSGFAFMWDEDGHGTVCASTVASRGTYGYAIYDNFTEQAWVFNQTYDPYYYLGWDDDYPDNNTLYSLKGMATGADVMAIDFLYGGYDVANLMAYLWTAGFDLMLPEAPTDFGSRWVYTGTHVADVTSNSYGFGPGVLFYFGMPGMDFWAVLLDILSTPNYFATGYPGTLFVSSSGNAGVGSGTMWDGGSGSSSGLTVGASTMFHYADPLYGEGVVTHDQLSTVTSRGPMGSGGTGLDVLANGYRAASSTAVWDHGYWNHFRPETAGYYGSSGDLTFGWWQGTSLACPIVAGVAALVIDAAGGSAGPGGYNATFSPQVVKSVIKTSAKDIGLDPFSQGTGRVDPVAAVNMAESGMGHIMGNKTSLTNAEMMAGVLAEYFAGTGYSDYEELPGTYWNLSWPSIFANYPGPVDDNSFYAGILAPGATSFGAMDFANTTDVTAQGVFNNLTSSHTGTITTNNNSAMYSSLYDGLIINVSLKSMGLTATEFSNAAQIEVMLSHDGSSSADGVSLGSMDIISWVDSNANDKIDFGTAGEYGMVQRDPWYPYHGGVFSLPVGNPAASFASYDAATLVVRFSGSKNDTDGTFFDVGGFTIDYTINVFERDTWDWVDVTFLSGSEWNVSVDVPSNALPGIYGGYVEIDSGILIPLSTGVSGMITERKAPSYDQITTWTASKTSSNPNYVFNVHGGAGEGDTRIIPVTMAAAGSSTLYVEVTTDTTGAEFDVFVLDSMGYEINVEQATTSTKFFTDISGYTGNFFIAVMARDLPAHEVQFTIDAACALDPIADIMPSVTYNYSGGNLYPYRMTGPQVEITGTYEDCRIFPEADVTDLEVWVTGVTADVITQEFEADIGANEYAYEYVDLEAGDIVDLYADWSGASGDLDIYVYDPAGDLVALPTSVYGMATGDHPETGNFVAAMTGEYELEIYEYEGATAHYAITVTILRSNPITAVGNSVTINTMNMVGNSTHPTWVYDGSYTLGLWGYTDTSMIWIDELDYTVDNWLPPYVNMTETERTLTSRGITTISWSGTDPNGAVAHYGVDPADNVVKEFTTIYYDVWWRMVSPSDVVKMPGTGNNVVVPMDWVHVMGTQETSLTWDFSEKAFYPDGMISQFMVMASDFSGEPFLYVAQSNIMTVTFDFAVDPITTTTTTTTETTTPPPATPGYTFMILIASLGIMAIFVLRRRRK
ncbi:MAG: S8 family serine peptidase [Candidatus Hodarchaeales archaeon]|jgi:hypothetical protein